MIFQTDWACFRVKTKTAALYLCLVNPFRLDAQSLNGVRYENLEFDPLTFNQPDVKAYKILEDVDVLFLEDNSLPLVSVFARFRGGTSHFSQEQQGVVTAVPMLLRSGGTVTLPSDSVDALLEYHAIDISFGRDGRTSFSALNTLTNYLDEALEIWGDLITKPRFSPDMVQVWRNQELDYLKRSERDPNTLAIRTFNRLIFGDHHPTGWALRPEDLELEDLAIQNLRDMHRAIFCRDNLTLGVTGNIKWKELIPKLSKLVRSIAPCERFFEERSQVPASADPGIYLIPIDLPQATIITGKLSGIGLNSTVEYFASQIGNLILGGSGLNSRLSSRIRTEAGLSYSASSIWTTPMNPPGVLASMTQTEAQSTVRAIKLISEILKEMTKKPPNSREVQDAVDEISNGFIFNFQNPAQVISRQMFYLTQGLPLNWLSAYLEGIQQVSPKDIHNTFGEFIGEGNLDDMVTVVVGDPAIVEAGLKNLGPLYIIEPR